MTAPTGPDLGLPSSHPQAVDDDEVAAHGRGDATTCQIDSGQPAGSDREVQLGLLLRSRHEVDLAAQDSAQLLLGSGAELLTVLARPTATSVSIGYRLSLQTPVRTRVSNTWDSA